MNSLSFTIGFNLGVEALIGEKPSRLLVCLCLDCVGRADPTGEYPLHRVPSHVAAECAWCVGADERDMRLVALPQDAIERGQKESAR